MARINATEKTATKRPRKSAEEKALADLDAALKTRDLAKKKLDKLKEGVEPAQAAFDKAAARVRFLQQNPDLPESARPAPAEPEGAEDSPAQMTATNGEDG